MLWFKPRRATAAVRRDDDAKDATPDEDVDAFGGARGALRANRGACDTHGIEQGALRDIAKRVFVHA